jgi:hypothetical protein
LDIMFVGWERAQTVTAALDIPGKLIYWKGLTAGQNVFNLQLFIATCQNACKMQNTCIFGTFANS